MLRPALALAVAAVCWALAGCGTAAKPPGHLRLQLNSPADGTRVRTDSILVSGNVSPAPAASVEVLGHGVAVSGGAFSTRVSLQPGTNIIDVLAGAPHARAAMTAVRVYRQVLVAVPDVSGDNPGAATRALRAIGLAARVRDDGEFFDFLLPVSPQVCSSDPPAGRSVAPGSTVTLSVSKTC